MSPSTPRLTIAPEAEPDEATQRAISDGLDAYNDTMAPGANPLAPWLVGRDGAGAAQAGPRGVTVFDWLCVKWLWAAEPYRGRGVGTRLLSDAEAIAREWGCFASYLDTFSFQAPGFYERLGYREFGRLEAFPTGHARIWFMKRLAGAGG